MKRIIIAGCRNFEDYGIAKEFIKHILNTHYRNDDVTILSGGCKGADLLGEKYAAEYGLELEIYKADWARYKKVAGPIRNREMVSVCDGVICFWDDKSRGTRSLIDLAKKNGKEIYIKKL